MAQFANNHLKSANTGHTPFELNCSFYPQAYYEKNFNLCSLLKSVDKL